MCKVTENPRNILVKKQISATIFDNEEVRGRHRASGGAARRGKRTVTNAFDNRGKHIYII